MPGCGLYLELIGVEEVGLPNPPPMEPSLATYLALVHNHHHNPSTLPSKHCRFSASQQDKIYRAQVETAFAMSSNAKLQMYQAMYLMKLGCGSSKKLLVAVGLSGEGLSVMFR